jgi:hypothetical protein
MLSEYVQQVGVDLRCPKNGPSIAKRLFYLCVLL